MFKNVFPALVFLIAVFSTQDSAGQDRREIPDYRTYGTIPSQEDLDEIAALLQAFKAAWSNQNTSNLMSLHSEDTEWINAFGRMFQSRVDLKEFISNRLFPNFPAATSKGEMDNLRLISTRYIGESVVIFHLYTESDRGASRNVDEELRRTHMHLVLAKSTGDWKIEHTAIFDVR